MSERVLTVMVLFAVLLTSIAGLAFYFNHDVGKAIVLPDQPRMAFQQVKQVEQQPITNVAKQKTELRAPIPDFTSARPMKEIITQDVDGRMFVLYELPSGMSVWVAQGEG